MGTVVVYHNVCIVSREIHYSKGFSKRDLERIVDFLASQEELILEAWNAIHEKD